METAYGFVATFGLMLSALLAYLVVTALVMTVLDRGYERRAPGVALEGHAFAYRATIGLMVRAHDWLARTIEPVLGWFEPEVQTSVPVIRHVGTVEREVTPRPSDACAAPSDVAISTATCDASSDDEGHDTDADDTDRDENGVVIPYTRRGEYPMRLQDGSYIILRNGS